MHRLLRTPLSRTSVRVEFLPAFLAVPFNWPRTIPLSVLRAVHKKSGVNVVEDIYKADIEAVLRYNMRASSLRALHPELGPSPYEGNIARAPVVLLLANPGFDERSSLLDHTFTAEGWPLAGLHESAPPGMRDWWRPRLRLLGERFGWQYVANRVAAMQLTPWASSKFDANLRLPSRAQLLKMAGAAARRGAVLIAMRQPALWQQDPDVRIHPDFYPTRSPLCSFVTPGNVGEQAWDRICQVMQSSSLS